MYSIEISGKMTRITEPQWEKLISAFGPELQRDVLLSRYTAARVGGPADGVIMVDSESMLERTALSLWELDIPFIILGGGANVLVSDAGVREIVVLNRAKRIEIKEKEQSVWAESGANFGMMARKVSARGYTGFEWAAGIPGTVGGAVYGNAGAHGWEVADNLIMATILHPVEGKVQVPSTQMGFKYRSSFLKREQERSVILSACFRIEESTVSATKALVKEFSDYRKGTQPPGASMGSMFKNPPGDFAGRLIDLAGLKGTRKGDVVISSLHGNFFINEGSGSSKDILSLINLARQKVDQQFGIKLDLEIELIGDWDNNNA